MTAPFPTSSIGDQLHPFTVTAQKMHLMPSIFDLAMPRPMKNFPIPGQYKCNDSYQRFLGNFLHIFYYTILFIFKYET